MVFLRSKDHIFVFLQSGIGRSPAFNAGLLSDVIICWIPDIGIGYYVSHLTFSTSLILRHALINLSHRNKIPWRRLLRQTYYVGLYNRASWDFVPILRIDMGNYMSFLQRNFITS